MILCRNASFLHSSLWRAFLPHSLSAVISDWVSASVISRNFRRTDTGDDVEEPFYVVQWHAHHFFVPEASKVAAIRGYALALTVAFLQYPTILFSQNV